LLRKRDGRKTAASGYFEFVFFGFVSDFDIRISDFD